MNVTKLDYAWKKRFSSRLGKLVYASVEQTEDLSAIQGNIPHRFSACAELYPLHLF